mmetsp:Transcript_26175/g.46553  ORF Transcript_26175/g.46553 Transcript_26175/m.46553 type:complete len:103 (-) Transcript_26175:154-462(-)|eukprot:CAMPEP_0177778640 /NCGR_PEP_ID=MMETSP0491_2-20121128/16071_1 /TAXON_ID=63592 /ORGANISM="Tetraselmis chuii, Strain PLY429" /LENGTH=102 /DNA_ID=CAMNT_0019297945 /DNA_START=696 /DNA_END=1004 /DNA_ORIENTATION=+
MHMPGAEELVMAPDEGLMVWSEPYQTLVKDGDLFRLQHQQRNTLQVNQPGTVITAGVSRTARCNKKKQGRTAAFVSETCQGSFLRKRGPFSAGFSRASSQEV